MQLKPFQTFAEYYKSVKEHNPSVINLDSDIVFKIEEELDKEKRINITRSYIAATLCVIFFLFTYPIIILKAYSFIIPWQIQLSVFLSQRQFFDNHLMILITITFLFFIIIVYTIIAPSKWFHRLYNSIPPRIEINFEVFNIETRKPLYIIYCSMLNYVNLLILLLIFHSYELIPIDILNFLTIGWLMIPMLILAALPSILFLFVLALIIDYFEQSTQVVKPVLIINNLVHLIYELDNTDEFAISNFDLKKSLTKSIIEISDLIRKMYRNFGFGKSASQWSDEQMEKVADNFISVTSMIYFPQSDTLDNLKDHLCTYLNIFLSGQYHELPREEITLFKGVSLTSQNKPIKKFFIFISLIVYMALPIVAIIIIIELFKLDIQPFIQSLLTILYIIWAIIGIFSYSDNLSPDTKEFMMIMVKSIIGKQ